MTELTNKPTNLRILNTTARKPNGILIEHLKEALALAESGAILEGAFCAELADGDSEFWISNIHRSMVGAVTEMSHALNQYRYENCRSRRG
jgi:hypothetical protein